VETEALVAVAGLAAAQTRMALGVPAIHRQPIRLKEIMAQLQILSAVVYLVAAVEALRLPLLLYLQLAPAVQVVQVRHRQFLAVL